MISRKSNWLGKRDSNPHLDIEKYVHRYAKLDGT